MKLVPMIVTGAAALLVVTYIAGFFLDDEVNVRRDITIDAPRDKVFVLVSDFNSWSEWSPWVQMDSDAIFAVTGAGMGHRMVWESDHPAIGEGAQTIINYEPPRMVETRLDLGGWGDGYGAFLFFEDQEGRTRIVWEYNGRMREGKSFLLKPIHTYYGLFMDEMLTPTYDRGLQQLKIAAEKPALPSIAEADASETEKAQ